MSKIKPLSVGQLYTTCNPAELGFKSTDELEDFTEIIAQDRALEAIKFGIGIRQAGYNLFALGPSGSGKRTVVMRFLAERASQRTVPPDWCYTNNFSHPHKPRVLQLPHGYGLKLSRDMNGIIEELRHAIQAAFSSDEYSAQVQEIEQELKDQQEQVLDDIRKEAAKEGVALVHTPSGFAFSPMKENEVITPSEYEKLPKQEQQHLEHEIDNLQDKLKRVLRVIPQWRSTTREKLKKLDHEVAQGAVSFHIEKIKLAYESLPQVVHYIGEVEKDILDNIDDFRSGDEATTMPLMSTSSGKGSQFQRYQVNVVIDHSDTQGAPVVYEDHPTYLDLVGRIEHIAMMGALVTDFRLIKAGALHRANGGYLVLDAMKLLQHPYAWEGLKRALRANEIRIQSLEQMLSLASTVSLEPDSVPLDIKVVLIGDRSLYYMLYHMDPEFSELFKVAVDFEDSIDRNTDNIQFYAQLVATLARQHETKPLTSEAVARIIERCSRIVEDTEKLSTHMRTITDLICEADYWAEESGYSQITGKDIKKAIDSRVKRSGRFCEKTLESIVRGSVFIDTQGTRVGTINGLTIMHVGDLEFGSPCRISAVVKLGEGDVINIEREVELSGAIHSKGVYILSSYLGARYAYNRPLSVSASIVFEQSYGEIDGDSASSSELYALLSALAEIPISQSLAATGSVNQKGDIQPIGGVNEKIEGFFDLCSARGLTGDQGVLIPASNIKHLMLREDILEAAANNKFHIYPIKSVDEGIEVLTGVDAGERDDKGEFPEGSFNYKVEQRLAKMAEIRHDFSAVQKTHEEHHEDENADAAENQDAG